MIHLLDAAFAHTAETNAGDTMLQLKAVVLTLKLPRTTDR